MAYFKQPGSTIIVDDKGNQVPDQQAALATYNNNLDAIPEFTGTAPAPTAPTKPAPAQPLATDAPQAQPAPTQPVQDATLAQGTQAPIQQGGKFGTQNFGRVGNDVVEIMSDGSQRPVSEAEFNQSLKNKGLNLEVLPQVSPTSDFSSGPSSGLAGAGPDGIFGTIDDIQAEPEKGPANFVSDYTNILKELGVTSIKDQFNDIQKQFKDLQDKKLEEQLEINDNPWLSEGVRVAKLRKLDERYAGKESNLTNMMKLTQSLYEEGLAQAKFLTSGLQEDRNKLLDLAMKREEAQMKMAQQEFENALDLEGLSLKQKDLALAQWKATQTGGGGSGQGGIYDMFDFRTANAILSEANKFETSDIVKRFNSVVDAKNTVSGFSSSSKNPADHQALVYAFAKALDPESVVREGEYNTISKYSQSLINRYEGEIRNALAGTGFLSAKAIKDIQETVNNLYNSRLPQYQNSFNSTSGTIDRIAGQQGASGLVLTDFSGGIKQSPPPPPPAPSFSARSLIGSPAGDYNSFLKAIGQ